MKSLMSFIIALVTAFVVSPCQASTPPSVFQRDGVYCGRSSNVWVPGLLSRGQFVSHQTTLTKLKINLKTAKGSAKAKLSNQIKALQARIAREQIVCKKGPKATPTIAPTATATPTPTPTATPTPTVRPNAITAGSGHTCAITAVGGIKCWGSNALGGLGDGTTTDRSTPVDVSGLTSGVDGVAAGASHTCAITTVDSVTGGGVLCWGDNRYLQLGDGTTTSRHTPQPVSGLTWLVRRISGGGWKHTCAIVNGNSAKCWGTNTYGEIGDGTTSPRSTPAWVSGLYGNAAAVTEGSVHSCALTTAGGVKCWGAGGRVGDGTTTSRSVPTDVSGLTSGVQALSQNGGGSDHTCAITTEGGLKCWGDNTYGQLGDGTTTERLAPVNVSGLSSGVRAVSVGYYHTCAVLTTGAVKCWGYNNNGQLGDNTATQRLAPVDVSGLTSGALQIAAGAYHSCVRLTTGAVKCWGWNTYGQLGDGTTTDRFTPVSVLGFGS